MIGNMSDVSTIIDIVINDRSVSKTEFLILLLLNGYGPHTASEIAEKTKYSRNWIYSLLGWLIHKKYVEEIPDNRPKLYAYKG